MWFREYARTKIKKCNQTILTFESVEQKVFPKFQLYSNTKIYKMYYLEGNNCSKGDLNLLLHNKTSSLY